MSHLRAPSNSNIHAWLSPISLSDIQKMDISLSRLDCLFLAKVADQAERYHGACGFNTIVRNMYDRPAHVPDIITPKT